MPDLKYLYRPVYQLKKLLIFLLINFTIKSHIHFFYILIIFLYSSVITVAVWLDNNFQTLKQILINQAGVRYPEVPKYLKHVYKHKMVK